MTSLSRMNKAQLYEECKRLRDHNMRLHLFQDDNLIKENEQFKKIIHLFQDNNLKKENEDLKKENVQLLNDVSCLEDLLKNQETKFSEELREYNLKFYEELKKEEEKDTLSAEEEMNMVEVLSEELGEKEQKIMNLEKEFEEQKKVLEKAEDSIEMAVFRDLVYQCPQCEYLTENRCKRYADPKYPDQDVFRCWECRNDDTTSEEEDEDLCDICGSDRDNHDLHTLEDGRTFLLPCERHLIPEL